MAVSHNLLLLVARGNRSVAKLSEDGTAFNSNSGRRFPVSISCRSVSVLTTRMNTQACLLQKSVGLSVEPRFFSNDFEDLS